MSAVKQNTDWERTVCLYEKQCWRCNKCSCIVQSEVNKSAGNYTATPTASSSSLDSFNNSAYLFLSCSPGRWCNVILFDWWVQHLAPPKSGSRPQGTPAHLRETPPLPCRLSPGAFHRWMFAESARRETRDQLVKTDPWRASSSSSSSS